MAKEITIPLGNKPKWRPGDKFFSVDEFGRIEEQTVRWINARIWKNPDKPTEMEIIAMSYDGNIVNFSRGGFDTDYYEDEMYRTREAAEKDAPFTKVEFTEDEWYKAIGLKDGVDRLEYDQECELSPCCANISDIRNALDAVRKHKGLTVRHRRNLQELLNHHECGIDRKDVLYKILKKIGVTWKRI